jgi:predicted Rossmann fold nucleotide-binding protein DprA/Smf involved in DNA uptake
MKPAPVTLPLRQAQRIAPETATRLIGVGNANLLIEPLLGFIASRQCPGHILIETLDRVTQWTQANRVLVSGFHSPLEQQVLRSLLRRKGRAVKVLARGMRDYRPEPDEKPALAENRLLVITAFPPTVTRSTRATALERNRLVLQLAAERVIPHIAPQSPLAELLREFE